MTTRSVSSEKNTLVQNNVSQSLTDDNVLRILNWSGVQRDATLRSLSQAFSFKDSTSEGQVMIEEGDRITVISMNGSLISRL